MLKGVVLCVLAVPCGITRIDDDDMYPIAVFNKWAIQNKRIFESQFRRSVDYLIQPHKHKGNWENDMPADNQAKILQYLVAAEKLGQEIIADRTELILLDKRRNHNREAIRALKSSGQSNCYITIGSVLIKNKVEQSLALLEADQRQLDIDINKIRSDLKVKVNDLRDLEMQPPVPGLSLVPISEKERSALAQGQLL